MPVNAMTPIAGVLDVGDTWLSQVMVTDDVYGYPLAATVAGTVTKPDGSTIAATITSAPWPGQYVATYVLATAGRHTLVVSVSGTITDAETFAVEAQATTTLPTLTDVKAYLAGDAGSWSDPELTDALTAEQAAQARVCRVGAVYPADLRQALLRRVQRNLALRGLPIAVFQGDSGDVGTGGPLIVPGRDPEVRRLEGPYRRLVVG